MDFWRTNDGWLLNRALVVMVSKPVPTNRNGSAIDKSIEVRWYTVENEEPYTTYYKDEQEALMDIDRFLEGK